MSDEKQAPAQYNESIKRWISFYLGDECYAVELRDVREILRINQILPVPGAPAHVLGITNIRGSVVAVIDGRQRIGLPDQPQDDLSRMIVLEYGDEVVCMVVDRVADVIDVPACEINPNPKINTHQGKKYIKGVVQHNNKLIIILNIERFLGAESCESMAVGF